MKKNNSLFFMFQRTIIVFGGIIVVAFGFNLLLMGLDLVFYPHQSNLSGSTNMIEMIEIIPAGVLLLAFQPISIVFWYPLTIGNLLYLVFFSIKKHPGGRLKTVSYLALVATLILFAVETYSYFFMQWTI